MIISPKDHRLAIAAILLLSIATASAQAPAGAGGKPGVAYGQYPAVFTQPAPMDFDDHEGYVSLFDGTSLKDWDGNPRMWRVSDGAIVGQSAMTNRSANTCLVYRGLQARDFTLKFEIKTEGSGGSGMQYRSKATPGDTNNIGPANPGWKMTGPQADFRASPVYAGAIYSENTSLWMLAWQGQAVESSGGPGKKLIGTIGDPITLARASVKISDWNKYTIIARGGTLIHIVNGQVMAIMVDDDPKSSNNQSGFIGIQLEPPFPNKIQVRNIWLKKLD